MLSQQDFIDRAVIAHGERYDYSSSLYVGGHKPISITCKKHGEFKQRPINHWRGMGCRKCQYEGIAASHIAKAGAFLTFEERSRKIHGERYSYERVLWLGTHKKVEIFCRRCQRYFNQSPTVHMCGAGCSHCNRSTRAAYLLGYLREFGAVLQTEVPIPGTGKRFDFYWPDCETYVEYDGYQHFAAVRTLGWKESFEDTKRRDAEKIAWVVGNGLSLVRVPYTVTANGLWKLARDAAAGIWRPSCLVIRNGAVVNLPPKYQPMLALADNLING